MVKRENNLYLFLGQDNISKNIKLNQLRREFLPRETEQFNLDILYAKDINVRVLQEKLLCLPVMAKRRMVIIKGAEALKKDIQDFLLKYAQSPYAGVILVLDMDSFLAQKSENNRHHSQNEFLSRIYKYSQIIRFKEEAPPPDAFMLSRYIDQRQPPYALRLLNKLLLNGERPERILGGLRYAYQKDAYNRPDKRRRLKLILNCDVDIKTGRLKPPFALEKLVVSLCCLAQSFS